MTNRGPNEAQPAPIYTAPRSYGPWRRRAPKMALVLTGVFVGWLAVARVGDAVPRLLRGAVTVAEGPDDLLHRHEETQAWFAGQPVYGHVGRATYPPAAYTVLWPFVGWLDLAGARILWAATCLAGLAALGWIGARQAYARGPPEVALVALFLAATSPAAVGIAVGQLSIPLLLAVVGGVLLLGREAARSNVGGAPAPRLSIDLAAATLMAAALIKPNSAIPFMLVAGVVARRLRPIVLIGAIYLTFTLVADAFQPADATTLMRQWLEMIRRQVHYKWGRANLHLWLDAVPLRRWRLPASLISLAALGMWTWRNRRADLWVLMGVTTIVSRLWAHHRFYDDVLLWVPAITLFRLVSRPRDGRFGAAGPFFLLVLLVGPLLLPYHVFGKRGTGAPVLEWLQVATWLVVLGYLGWQTKGRPSEASEPPSTTRSVGVGGSPPSAGLRR